MLPGGLARPDYNATTHCFGLIKSDDFPADALAIRPDHIHFQRLARFDQDDLLFGFHALTVGLPTPEVMRVPPG